jgi:hypothetical protein
MTYESTIRCESAVLPGVAFRVARMSFGRRMQLVRELRDIAAKAEYNRAGAACKDQIEATLLEAEADKVHVRWGLAGIEGLEIDGAPATAESLITSGPEAFFREVVQRIRSECFLSEEERKN